MCFFVKGKGKGEEWDERRRRIPQKKTKPRERGEVPTTMTNGLALRGIQSRRWGTAWEEGGRGGGGDGCPPAGSSLREKWRMGLGNWWKAGEVVLGWVL